MFFSRFLQRRRRLENEISTLSNELSSLRSSYDEECELRIDLERKLSGETAQTQQYKSKYELECRARCEEVEEVK